MVRNITRRTCKALLHFQGKNTSLVVNLPVFLVKGIAAILLLNESKFTVQKKW